MQVCVRINFSMFNILINSHNNYKHKQKITNLFIHSKSFCSRSFAWDFSDFLVDESVLAVDTHSSLDWSGCRTWICFPRFRWKWVSLSPIFLLVAERDEWFRGKSGLNNYILMILFFEWKAYTIVTGKFIHKFMDIDGGIRQESDFLWDYIKCALSKATFLYCHHFEAVWTSPVLRIRFNNDNNGFSSICIESSQCNHQIARDINSTKKRLGTFRQDLSTKFVLNLINSWILYAFIKKSLTIGIINSICSWNW